MWSFVVVFCSTLVVGTLCLECSQDVLDQLSALQKQMTALETRTSLEIRELKQRLNRQEKSARSSRALDDSGRIAFTAYLSDDVDNLARNDGIIFDEILHNDGDAYNNQTGVFTAPMAGVYFFTYFLGERDKDQINTMLAVNSQNYVDVIVEGLELKHNVQSGNAATVKLAAGDTVQVMHRMVGDHVEGGAKLRLSTFTGFMLYPIDDDVPSIIIG